MKIKVGDKFNFEEDEWIVVELSECDDTLIARTKDGDDSVFFQSTVYRLLYEQQKQRADDLEKRWSELKESIMHMPCNQVGQISPRYIFDKIKQLEEDGE